MAQVGAGGPGGVCLQTPCAHLGQAWGQGTPGPWALSPQSPQTWEGLGFEAGSLDAGPDSTFSLLCDNCLSPPPRPLHDTEGGDGDL